MLAGGGTGGHLSPGLAIAERLRELEPPIDSLFACSSRASDAKTLQAAGVSFAAIPAQPPGLAPRALLRYLRGVMPARRRSQEVVRTPGACAVVALGGFVSAPVVAAARRAGLPVLLVNLDAVPGRANRFVARRATRVVSAVPTPGFPRFASEIVGTPIRSLAISGGTPEECRSRLGLEAAKPTLLVTGASQGAATVNLFATEFARAHASALREWQVLHLAGPGADCAGIAAAYREACVRAVVLPYLLAMGDAWGAADAAVSRAGANSVAEALANRVPTLFLPYPYHADMHQTENARPLVTVGGACMSIDRIDPSANVREAGGALLGMVSDPERRRRMRDALAASGIPAGEAPARRIAQLVRELAGAG